MEATSPWMPPLETIIKREALFVKNCDGYKLSVRLVDDSLWVSVECIGGCYVLLRAAYAPNGVLKKIQTNSAENSFKILLQSSIGRISVVLQNFSREYLLFRYTTSLTPSGSLFMPFWPRDLVIINHNRSRVQKGEVHISQTGTRSGLQYIGLKNPAAGNLLYFHNLTSLNDYCQVTKTSLADCIGGKWPELGFALPPASNTSLTKNKTIIIADAYVAFHKAKNTNIFADA